MCQLVARANLLLIALSTEKDQRSTMQQAVEEVLYYRDVLAEVQDALARLEGHRTLNVVQGG